LDPEYEILIKNCNIMDTFNNMQFTINKLNEEIEELKTRNEGLLSDKSVFIVLDKQLHIGRRNLGNE
jgi:hypothetical protein